MQAGPRARTLLHLTVLSCLCSVPPPSSEGAVGEASACLAAFCDEGGGCPCAAPPIQPYQEACSPCFDFGAAFKLRREPAQLGCRGIAAERVPGKVTHWVPCWPGYCPIGLTSWLDLGPILLLRMWLEILTLRLSLGTIHCRACHTRVPWQCTPGW